ncbi:hypothetical protein HHK36_024122 [Tetracentron sinense]|uniref:Pentatricopeptide repeat-containing protein n=1 Tax=Tetracentron sinense TaxID=13715 RepID=A0A834YN69_TETSI|nr:hypothetical protein HHK36_024122 [Tetracentron sinense]
MAISSSLDWSLTSITPYRKTHFNSLISTSKILPFLSFPCSSRQFLLISSCGCLSRLLEDASNDLQNFKLDLKIPDPGNSPTPDYDNLNDFLRGLCKDPRTEGLAFEYYQKAKDLPGFRPDQLTLELLIRYLMRLKKWNLIALLSEDFITFRIFPDSYTCSRLLSSCIRARKFKIAHILLGIFESDGERAVSAFDSAMRGYNKLHMYSSTILVYEQMKSAGIQLDSCCYCRIMEAYKKIGDIEKVITLFYEFESRKLDFTPFSMQIYGIFFHSLGKSGRASEALGFFREMTKKEILEDSSIYCSLICSFANIRDVKVAEELFREANKKKMLRDPAVFLNLVLMYVEEGLLEKTLEIVKMMMGTKIRVPDHIFCTVVNSYSKKRGLRAALRVYEELISLGCEPGQVTYASMINVYCRLGLYSKAEIIFYEMEQKGFDKCVVAYSSMVSMYGKVGRLRDAMRLVAKMKERGCEPNVWIYNSLMDMHGRVKNLRQVEKLWKEMKRRKVVPDKISYTTLISAYNKARDFEACMKFYQEFRINGGVIDRAMAGIMVGVFSKSSRTDELVKLLQDMKSEETGLDERLYRSAMNALRDAGFQVHAKWFQENFDATKVLCFPANGSVKTTHMIKSLGS